MGWWDRFSNWSHNRTVEKQHAKEIAALKQMRFNLQRDGAIEKKIIDLIGKIEAYIQSYAQSKNPNDLISAKDLMPELAGLIKAKNKSFKIERKDQKILNKTIFKELKGLLK
jgi:hypothetical protein